MNLGGLKHSSKVGDCCFTPLFSSSLIINNEDGDDGLTLEEYEDNLGFLPTDCNGFGTNDPLNVLFK